VSAATPLPTEEQQARARWDTLLADLEMRAEQVRQMKRYEPWKLAAGLASASAVAGSAVAAAILWAAHLLS